MSYPLPAQVGELIGSYRLDEVLSQGGMATVYKATHTKLDRVVAVKLLRTDLAEDEQFAGRLMREARIANAIRSPHVVEVTDVVELEAPRRLALIMELIEGRTLAQELERGPLGVSEACTTMLQLIDVLEKLHVQSIIHRDLKPSNVMLVGTGSPFVKLLDFGVGKVKEGEDEIRTMTGIMLGTPNYMAPEQVAALPVSPSADVFALGAMFYEMLVGRPAYTGRRLDVMRQKIRGRLPKLDLPANLIDGAAIRALIVQCLSASPDERPTLERLRTRLLFLASRASAATPASRFVPFEATRCTRPLPGETFIVGADTIVDATSVYADIDNVTVELHVDEAAFFDEAEIDAPIPATVRRHGFPCLSAIVMGGVVGALAQLGIGLLN